MKTRKKGDKTNMYPLFYDVAVKRNRDTNEENFVAYIHSLVLKCKWNENRGTVLHQTIFLKGTAYLNLNEEPLLRKLVLLTGCSPVFTKL